MPILDVESVRAFVAIAECQSFTRAARLLGMSQAAVSARLKRLEERVGFRLVERTPRRVRLSGQGFAFLEPARELIAAHDRAVTRLGASRRSFRLGLATSVVGPELPSILARLGAHDPSLTVELRQESSHDLAQLQDAGALDAAIIRREDNRREGETLGPEYLQWFAAPGFAWREGEALRVAASSPTCHIRNVAAEVLDHAGLHWTETLLGCGAMGVAEAVSAGNAVAVFPHTLAPAGAMDVGARLGLPPLPASEVLLISSLSDRRSRAVLRAVSAAFRDHREAMPAVTAA